MNKNKFIGLIIMMLISISGIIWVQTVWIRNAVGIQNYSFNNTVFAGLNNVARILETNRQTELFNSSIMSDFLIQSNGPDSISEYLSINRFNSNGESGFEININRYPQDQPFNNRINNSADNTINNGDNSYIPDSLSFGMGTPNNLMTGNQLRYQAGAFANQTDFIQWVQRRMSELQSRGDQMISELYDWEKNLVIDKNEVRTVLQQTLLRSGINTPFEFAIVKDGIISDGYFKQSREADFQQSEYKIPLFTDRIFKQDVVLSVVFPKKNNFVLGSMALILGGSFLFSLIILATFGLSLFFIIRQKKISEMKSDFINNMTHEFKTPIATISLAADTITNPKVINDETGIRHFIELIKKENSRMNKQVETILQIASLDKDEMDFVFDKISIHSIIERACETIGIQISQKEGILNLYLKAENPIISGDSEHLTNLIHNLLDNANKYSPEVPDIRVSTVNVDKGVLISVEDKGIGMTKAVQSKIFERFYRQATGNIHNVKGFGLGLSYVKAIVEAHRGNITVTSEPGIGSRFDVFLPFKGEN